ncbi:MAG: YceI family protein [Deferrisomatales bacterium]|nr:YceI family protein [Deferrisomatales bacterium]
MAKWMLDPEHTSATFEVRHMMVTWVTGRFDRITGTLLFDPTDVGASSVAVEIDASSISTGVDRRDEDLRSDNYLDVKRFPAITFRSTGVESAGLDHCQVHGDLTIHGVTRPVLLDVRFCGPSHFQDDDRRYTTYGFRAKTQINREDFGIRSNLEIENGGFMVGKHLFLTIDAEADLLDD